MIELFNESSLEKYVTKIVDARIDKKLQQPQTQAERELFTRKELKELLHTSYPSIDRWTAQGLLTKLFVGSRGYFDAESVYKLVDAKEL